MQEALAQVLTYVWGVWRHKWVALIIAWLLALGGWVYVANMPEAYVATAKLYVDTNSVLRPLLRGLAVTPNINQRMTMLSKTLLSRPNLEKLGRMTDLDLLATNEQAKDNLVNRLRNSISLSGERRNSSIYNISVKDRDRETARRITQALLTVFIESSLNDKRDDSVGAQDFLDEQIADYERRLIEAEGRLARFKQENVDVLPGQGGDYYTRYESVRQELEQAQLQLEEMTNRRDDLRRQLDGEDKLSFEGLGVLSPTEERIQQLQLKLDVLLMRYTDKHPEARQIQGLIAELTEQNKADLAAMKDVGSSGAFASSPLYQDMRSMLAEAEAGVAELNVRVEEYQSRSTDLAAKVNQIPEIEAQLKQLDRDYEVINKQYQQFLQRRESARVSQDVEESANEVNFRIIDPPYVPREPSEPNKTLLNAGVLVAALGAGIGVALLLSLLNPLVTDTRSLVLATGLPLLGTVTFNKSTQEVRKDFVRLTMFASASAGLLLTFAAVTLGTGVFF